MNERIHPILMELRTGLEQLYDDRLVGVIVFGSQARGDATSESDIDVLVVLRPPVDPSAERTRTIDLIARLCLEHNVVIGCIFVDEPRYYRKSGPFLRNVWHEGLTL